MCYLQEIIDLNQPEGTLIYFYQVPERISVTIPWININAGQTTNLLRTYWAELFN
jgi:hypothetical protein